MKPTLHKRHTDGRREYHAIISGYLCRFTTCSPGLEGYNEARRHFAKL